MTRVNGELASLLEFIRDLRGFDFSTYKPTSLERRVRKRMHDVGCKSYADYRDVLETDADEFAQLFNTVLINVTSFFRDPESWAHVRDEIIPAMIRQDGELRAWSAGCASGEEAYTLAVVLADAMGVDELTKRVKIYATDIDEEALATARKGVYPLEALESIPEPMREKYFEPGSGGMAVRSELRRRVIFGRLNLINDAPISRIDLLCCRNTLMYFNAETQDQVLRRLHFALRDNGVLFLGKAEMLMTNGNRFVPVSMPYRIFRRRPGSERNQGYLGPVTPGRAVTAEALHSRQLRDLALEEDPTARVLVEASGTAVLINQAARGMFGLTVRDEGRPLRDLEMSYRPIELRSAIEQAQSERRVLRMNAIERSLGPDVTQYLDVQVVPIVSADGLLPGTMVTFTDVTTYVRLQQEIKKSREELESAYEELQSTNEELETANEELETTNEEVQSTNEELETTNEELQSTNEELETANEELQSTNEELETMNEELRIRSSELDQANDYLAGVLSNVPIAVVVMDSELRVRTWNLHAEELWGLRREEVHGKSFFSLDIGLPTGPLRPPVRDALGDGIRSTIELDATNRRGQAITCTVTCAALTIERDGVILLMEAKER